MSGTGTAQQRAEDFVSAQGDALARGRARALRGGDPGEALRSLEEAAGDPSRPELLERILSVCDELRCLRAPLAARALAMLEAQQSGDGAFADPALPRVARLQRTGLLGGILARSPYGRPETLAAAGDFLADHFTPDLFEGFQWESIAAYARFFANAPHDAADAVLQWCGRELERGFRAREFDALRSARVLVLCDAHGLPGARLDREELILGLLAEQSPDGSFGAASAADARVESTLQGLHALVFLGGASPALDRPSPAR